MSSLSLVVVEYFAAYQESILEDFLIKFTTFFLQSAWWPTCFICLHRPGEWCMALCWCVTDCHFGA